MCVLQSLFEVKTQRESGSTSAPRRTGLKKVLMEVINVHRVTALACRELWSEARPQGAEDAS